MASGVYMRKNMIPYLLKRFPEETHAALNELGDKLLAEALAEAPEVTGNLKNSHDIDDAAGYATRVVAGGDRAPYAFFVHYGWVYYSGNPWLQRAAESVQPWWDARAAQIIERSLRGT